MTRSESMPITHRNNANDPQKKDCIETKSHLAKNPAFMACNHTDLLRQRLARILNICIVNETTYIFCMQEAMNVLIRPWVYQLNLYIVIKS